MRTGLILLLLGLILPLGFAPPTAQAADPTGANRLDQIFGSRAVVFDSLDDLPYWLGVLSRHRQEDTHDQAVLMDWFQRLEQLAKLPPRQQVQGVNEFINQKRYVLDMVNYGQEDYWAIAREFLALAGDCEDFSISKFFSLRALGFPASALRLVILQDTNLGIAHAVLAVALDNDILILDNQTNTVLNDRQIRHYRPLYSVNEEHWWLHTPTTN